MLLRMSFRKENLKILYLVVTTTWTQLYNYTDSSILLTGSVVSNDGLYSCGMQCRLDSCTVVNWTIRFLLQISPDLLHIIKINIILIF